MPSGRAVAELQIINPVLTQVARQYKPAGFVYSELCPSIPVDALAGQYPTYDETYWFGADGDNKLSDRAKTPRIEFSWSTDTYNCQDYGLAVDISPRERQQASVPGGGAALRLETSKTQFLMTQMALRREIRLAAKLRKISNGGQLNLGGAATTAFATSTVIESDWETAKTAAFNKTGLLPNVAVIPYAKAVDMANNTQLRSIWAYFINASGYQTVESAGNGEMVLPREFHGTRIVIARSLKQSGHEGAAKSLSSVWPASVIFLYVDPNAAWGVPSTVYSFSHPVLTGEGRANPTGDGVVVDQFRENDPVLDVTRATECYDEKVCAADLGYELTGV